MAGSARSRSPEPRAARAEELGALPAIEQRAGELLKGHPAYTVFAGHGLDLQTLQEGLQRGQLWVVDAADGGVAGYLLAGELCGEFHVLQMDVDPTHARRGHGRALLRHAMAQARGGGYAAAVLTTLSDVPWNAAFYASEGFAVVPQAEWNDGLRAVMAEEAALGFPMNLRVVMRRVW
ncbi:putative acetyltransferase [Stenotrophomonas maltophilia RA8]|uniref:GCN5-related N-acetyltransferase n=1 Tax=Stenotrophomonas maltophilia (strain R551-3) TaxID=391008 RepID=B4SJR5_STRM5|nr:GNAT family N-acetyltransferase [Stenotrophomonas maltophilia]ACF53206.1 GCN5-related N-acetyltransferase [Stenotrophomonas maltophilia R551-3]MBN5143946.1 GNAT family N-acetyltransferase [Stenotrophomonas maltophilia]OCK45432.1 acetyltransferase [Stenotrophomonas maltophilia]QGL77793.1 GNAT family N-acetyltransferase [Stenotrophomonas maltophilia]CCP18448.1 putative acetyltransferase [Stenotrophomonas maltophilia RA8]